jgi:hypothetical protein
VHFDLQKEASAGTPTEEMPVETMAHSYCAGTAASNECIRCLSTVYACAL